MKTIAMAASLGLAAAALWAIPAPAAEQSGEEKLAKMLEGREAGKPVSCIPLAQASESRVIDRTAIVYRVGATLYVNRPYDARYLDDNDIMLVRLNSSELCSVDIVHTKDRGSLMDTGFISLGDFVPYRKVAKGH